MSFVQNSEKLNMKVELASQEDEDDDDEDDEETQNLHYLVKQLVAEASLSDLNGKMKPTGNNFKMYKPAPVIKKANNNNQNLTMSTMEEFDNFNSTSLDLEKSEFVDDDFENNEDKQSSISEDMNNEISLINYGPNGFQMNNVNNQNACCMQHNDDCTDGSLADIDIDLAYQNQHHHHHHHNSNNKLVVPLVRAVPALNGKDSKRSASTTYSTTINISPLNHQAHLISKGLGSGRVFEANSNNNNNSADMPKNNLDFNNIKIEKKIRLNYRKPHNNNNFNFGTLC